MSTVALCALLLASGVGEGDDDARKTRTIEQINDLNANKERTDDARKEHLKEARATQRDEQERVLEHLRVDTWPAVSRRAAADMIQRFGAPEDATDDKLIWKDVGNFKKIMVSREGDLHRFPVSHTDVLTYVIDYKVPPSRFDDLAYFDGSVHADRTKGELSARCDSHEMNIAALNLADDIIRGRRTIAQARANIASIQRQVERGNPPAIARTLSFDVNRMATADPDRPANRAVGR